MSDDPTDLARWSAPIAAPAEGDPRTRFAAQFIPAGARVLDLGCGAMALEAELPAGCRYAPSDVVARDGRTLVCNLNAEGPPPETLGAAVAQADVITLLGVVEYLADFAGLLPRLAASGAPIVFTYHPTEAVAGPGRAALGWVSHHSLGDLAAMAAAAGYAPTTVERLSETQYLIVARPRPPAVPEPKRVAVLSYSNIGNFGDRLGHHLLPTVLPPGVEVEHFTFKPWTARDIEPFDLLIVGIGNSLFEPVLTDELQTLVEAARRSIGVFGTQYRASLPRERLARLLGRLDMWFARSEEDLLLYGEHARAAAHLGDWLIDAFAMARPTTDQPLAIGREVMRELPLDRTIQQIQRHRQVRSTRLHPLLCALTSAEEVAYAEQREMAPGEVSGKFRSMLYDIFGRTYPEGRLWRVDRPKVVAYKQQVAANVTLLRRHIAEALYGAGEGRRS
jgi:hypothetical protein